MFINVSSKPYNIKDDIANDIAVNCATNAEINNNDNNYSDFLDIQLKDVGKLKNHTHVKKVGHTSEFLFDIY